MYQSYSAHVCSDSSLVVVFEKIVDSYDQAIIFVMQYKDHYVITFPIVLQDAPSVPGIMKGVCLDKSVMITIIKLNKAYHQ